MAQSLTEERKVAWKAQGLGPDPAHRLVIFKRINSGKVLHRVLEPGETLKLSWLEKPDSYEAYAVSADENLRHRFSRKYQAAEQTWTFTLDFNLHFRVTNAERLALHVSKDDPLQRLEREVADVLSAAARCLPWEILKREGTDFGARLRDAETADGQGERKTNYRRLQEFAGGLGLEIRHLDISRTLTEADLEIDIVTRSTEVLTAKAIIQQQLDVETERLTHELGLLRDRHRLERDIAVAQGMQALQGMERLRMVLDGIAKEGIRALSQSVEGIRSFPAIQEALVEMQGIQASLAGLLGTQAHTPASQMASGSPAKLVSPPEHLPEGSVRASDPLERLVAQSFHLLRSLRGNPGDHRRILATVLHLVAESGLGREADEEFLFACRDDLENRIRPVESALEKEQLVFLRSILEVEGLRQKLAWEDSRG